MTNPTEWSKNVHGGSYSTADLAKDQATSVRDTAVDAGKSVASTAKDEVANVAAETKIQAKSLLSSVSEEVQTQAGSQQQRIAGALQAISKELGSMASGSEESGPLTDLALQASSKGGEIARWLENKEPRDVLTEVSAFARRRPATFLALCALAGVVAGRLTRGAVAANTTIDSPEPDPSAVRTATGPSDTYPVAELDREPISLVEEAPTYAGAASGAGSGVTAGYDAPRFDRAPGESDLTR